MNTASAFQMFSPSNTADSRSMSYEPIRRSSYEGHSADDANLRKLDFKNNSHSRCGSALGSDNNSNGLLRPSIIGMPMNKEMGQGITRESTLESGYFSKENIRPNSDLQFPMTPAHQRSFTAVNKQPFEIQSPQTPRFDHIWHHLEQTIGGQGHWNNVPDVVRSTFRDMMALISTQQQKTELLQTSLTQMKADIGTALQNKADVQDVSNAITEVIVSVDSRKQVERLEKKLEQTKIDLKDDLAMNTNEKMLPIIDGFRNEMKSLLTRVQESENREKRCKGRWHDLKKETNDQLLKLTSDVDKLTASHQRQTIMDELSQRDRRQQTSSSERSNTIPVQLPSTQSYQKSIQTKITELEQTMNYKVDVNDVQELMQSLEMKFEDAFTNIHDQMMRKASGEDLQYMRRDQGYKADKDEVEAFKQDLSDKLTLLNQKLDSKDKYIKALGENIEARVEQRLTEWRGKVNKRIEESLNENVDNIKKLGVQLNKDVDDLPESLKQYKEDLEQHVQQMMIKARAEDIEGISELMKNQQAKSQEMENRMIENTTDTIIQLEDRFSKQVNKLGQNLAAQLDDKVRVNEVRDALKQVSETHQQKLERVKDAIAETVGQELDAKKEDLDQALQKAIEKIPQFDQFKDSMEMSLDNSAQAVLAMQEVFHKFKKDLESKPAKQEVIEMIEAQAAPSEELNTDIDTLTQNMKLLVAEISSQKNQQQQFNNEIVTLISGTGRWIFTRADLVNQGACLQWDSESINCDGSLFNWQKGSKPNEGSTITVEKAGLYLINVALFVNTAASNLAPVGHHQANVSQALPPTSMFNMIPSSGMSDNGMLSPEPSSPKKVSFKSTQRPALQGSLFINGSRTIDLSEFSTVDKPKLSSDVTKSQQLAIQSHMMNLQTNQVVRLAAGAKIQVAFISPHHQQTTCSLADLPTSKYCEAKECGEKKYKVAVVEGCISLTKV